MTAIPVERPATGTGELVPARRPMPPWLVRTPSVVVSGIGEACQRVVEFAVARYVKSAAAGLMLWPLTDGGQHEIGIASVSAVTVVALATGRRRSLLRVGEAIRYRSRVRKVRRKWRHVTSIAALRRRTSATELVGKPTKAPDRVDIPVLMAGRHAWRLDGWKIRYFGPRKTPYGIRITVDGENTGHIVHAFASEAAVIQGGLGATSAAVMTNQRLQHLTDISILWGDPFAKPIPRASLPASSSPDLIPVGFDQDGDLVEKSLWLPHLTVGESGAGKSSETHVIIAGIVDMDVPLRLWVFDPKGGVEFECYEHTAYRYVRSPYKWVDLLRELIEVMQSKLDRLRGRGREASMWNPDFGLDVLVIDELLSTINFVDDADLANKIKVTVEGETRKMKPSEAMNHMLSQQRAAAMVTLANSQMAQKEKIKNRDMYPDITCLRVGFDETVTMLGFSPKEHPAHLIPPGPEYSGIGFTKTARGIVKYRSAWMPDSERAEVAQRVAKWTRYYRERERV